MTIGTLFFAPSNFVIVGSFPPAVYGVPYDATLNFAGAYTKPVITDAINLLALPPGLIIETSSDGKGARLYGTPEESMSITGTLATPIKGVPYSSKLKVKGNGGTSKAVVADISAGSLPPWASIAWHGDTNEIEIYGTPT